MKSSLIYLLFLVGMSIVLPMPAAYAEQTRSVHEIDITLQEVAAKGLPVWLSLIPKGDLPRYGFSNDGQLLTATLGKPFRLYTIPSAKIKSHAAEEVTSIVSPVGERWFFPVASQGHFRTLLEVARVQDKYKVVGIGGAEMAAQLDNVRARWPLINGFQVKIVRIFMKQSFSDFVLITGGGQPVELVPLESANLALGLSPQRTMTLDALRQQPLKSMGFRSLLPRLEVLVK